jgi:hypothetical protein
VTESINQRVHKYLLDGSDEDLKRLLVISEHMAERARTALRRSGIQAGWDVVECGCGPVGALPVIADGSGPLRPASRPKTSSMGLSGSTQ